jgi:hypothetical protein
MIVLVPELRTTVTGEFCSGKSSLSGSAPPSNEIVVAVTAVTST